MLFLRYTVFCMVLSFRRFVRGCSYREEQMGKSLLNKLNLGCILIYLSLLNRLNLGCILIYLNPIRVWVRPLGFFMLEKGDPLCGVVEPSEEFESIVPRVR
ncbi:hypothetical protein SADUNF_Sadunf01G0125200 [Salix dunnii]|uniref:Uncharacterized protein n=1 Tax=Salix dunnii TaxID=1413687 RepID=A0A835NBR5_9ROSI|nr:hypothetical protein SADUNF_Sadunf01G0125200 [Salix dunnii]